jgi:hypothetical protein
MEEQRMARLPGRRRFPRAIVAFLMLTAAHVGAQSTAADEPYGDERERREVHRLIFEPVAYPAAAGATPVSNALPGTTAEMTIRVGNGTTRYHFTLRNGFPDTVYTIWTVFYPLKWPLEPFPGIQGVPAFGARPTEFPHGGFPVAPLGRLDRAYTGGMGLDTGATFVTDSRGHAEFRGRLDYDLLGGKENGPPVGNASIVTQCVPHAEPVAGACPPGTKKLSVTGAWLRKYVIDVVNEGRDPSATCANYDPALAASYAIPTLDPLYWQCIDPETLLPRIHRAAFDHFRLAPHPDAMTHGFLGGNVVDHFIDMVGRRCRIDPRPSGEAGCN